MILDLSDDTSLDNDLNQIFNQISKNNIDSFNTFLHKAYELNYDNLEWYLSVTASRNPLHSNLFKNYCYYHLVNEVINSKKFNITRIIVKSKGLYELINNEFGKKIKVDFKKKSINKKIYLFFYKLYEINLKIYQFIISRLTRAIYKNKILNNNIIIIDTFVFTGFVNRERYYNNLTNFLDKQEKEKTYFLSTITDVKFKNIFKTYKEIRLSKKNFIIKEDLLNIFDYFLLIPLILNIKKINFKQIFVDNKNFSVLLNDDLNLLQYSLQHSLEGFLSFRAIKNLKKKKINVDLFINWWENQTLDKAYNYALSKFYPNTKSIGYIGFAPRNFDFHIFPTLYEVKHKIIPKKIAVIGSGYKELIKKFNKSLDVISAPSFRFNHIYKYNNKYRKSKKKRILIGLPILLSKSIELIRSLPKNIDLVFSDYEIEILIKPHPTISRDIIRKYINFNYYKNCFITTEDTYDILKKSDILISSMSSICMESIAMNIPCIVFDESIGLEYIPVPSNIDKSIWNLCKNNDEILQSIEEFFTLDIEKQKKNYNASLLVKQKYFKEVNKFNVKNFLGINN